MGSCLLCLWCAGVPLLSLDIAMMGIGEWVFSPAAAASLQSFCALCCSPYLFLSQLEEKRSPSFCAVPCCLSLLLFGDLG